MRSLIIHRRFNRTYGIWQGSDVDVEQRIEEARQKLTGAFSLAEAVQEFLPPRPLVARRHSYQTGTVRYFEVRYVDLQTRAHLSLQSGPGASGLLLICLPTNFAEAEAFASWGVETPMETRADIVLCIAERLGRLVELVSEMRCLQWVRENTPELRDDPVARREVRMRAGYAGDAHSHRAGTHAVNQSADESGWQQMVSSRRGALDIKRAVARPLHYLRYALLRHAAPVERTDQPPDALVPGRGRPPQLDRGYVDARGAVAPRHPGLSAGTQYV
jgi:hypothetical protein